MDMPGNKAVIGLTWEPDVSSFSQLTKPSSDNSIGINQESSNTLLYKSNSELIDGLYVPSNDPRKVNRLMKKQVKDTTGKKWFDMPAPVITPELKQDLQLLKLRAAIDPKRHYKKGELKSKALPKYFQVGTVVEDASEFYSSRLKKKERKSTFMDELLHDTSFKEYRKRKVREIEEKNRPGGNEKWNIKGKQTRKRAKERRRF